ncbi:MAG: hypothetical protein LH472_08920 [Pyrinomonadaceae bacterium]|nr:hypothetical protein [Pyrinomonadaceae bacterium]
MAKKKKQSKNPADILSRKKNKLDWETFTFLENLLVFCLCKNKSVPAESGVKFQINLKENDDSICLLFNTDRRKDSLFRNDEIKPDYMVLYVKKDLCLCTIIEMKGKTEKGAKHGIDQIKTLHTRLKEEIKNNLPNKFKVKFQAILLTQFNADIPRNLIVQEKSKGLTILPLQYNNRAELFNYISKENQITEKYIHENIKQSGSDFLIEKIFAESALHERIADNFSLANKDKINNGEKIYINYCLSDQDYAALAIDNAEMKIGVKEATENFTDNIKNDLLKLGLEERQHYKIQKIN